MAGQTSSSNRHLLIILSLCVQLFQLTSAQLPDDIQRELNQNLAEQARIQAMRAQHQNQIKNRVGATGPASHNGAKHDPNNYSYQQVSPPIQYSYYQPFGDAAAPAQQQQPSVSTGANSAQQAPINIDLNNLNFDLPTPQAQTAAQPQGRHMTPSFTGAGGLPIMKPMAASSPVAPIELSSQVPAGSTPLAPQARVQQGPPLTEADFKDITGSENYGAPGGSDFGMGSSSSPDGGAETDAQLREFGMPSSGGSAGRRSSQPQQLDQQQQMNIPDFGAFGSMDGGGSSRRAQPASSTMADTFGFGNLDPPAGGSGMSGSNPTGGDFDFASQPSSNRADQTQANMGGGAPGSLQSLLGSSFPGLAGSQSGDLGGLDGFGQSAEPQQSSARQGQSRANDGSLDMTNLDDRSDQFSGANLGGFEQPSQQNDQDFNYAAASSQQPSSVPYPDGSPQPVGTLLALTQPESLSQARYNALPDKGTYQDYPAYADAPSPASVADVVDETPRARAPGPGRYGRPSALALAAEHRPPVGHQFDYAQSPGNTNSMDGDDGDQNDIY